MEEGELLPLGEMESLVGRLGSVGFLVEGGHFYLDGFYRSMVGVKGSKSPVQWVGCLQAQARWWRISLMVACRYCPIRFPEEGVPGDALRVWTDAAGGSLGRIGPGLGVVFPRTLSWAYLPWPT